MRYISFFPSDKTSAFLHTILPLLVLFCYFVGVESPFVSAQSSAKAEIQNVVCQTEMGKFLEQEFDKYRQFIETHFQNKSSTSSLLENAFLRYREFRTTLMKQYSTYHPQSGALQLTEGIESGACLQQIENTLQQARLLLENRARSSSAVKKATALIDKYQELNSKLRILTQNFLRFKASLDTFAAKLPCYINKSCNKG